VVEAVMLWNEPNNMSHWDFGIDRGWHGFAEMTKLASAAVAAENPRLTRVLGGISPIDPNFIRNMAGQGVLDAVDVVAVHGFPLDWSLWPIEAWPAHLEAMRQATHLPVWITEVGVSSFGSEALQAMGLRHSAELLRGQSERIHWYSLFDLPGRWEATTRHKAAEGSSYFRHFHMGLVREDGSPKPALKVFADYAPEFGICQWFHFEDHRLDCAVRLLKELGVKKLRTGLSWSDDGQPRAEAWFDRQMRALEDFEVTLTFCYTPEEQGVVPHYTSPPREPEAFADFCARMVRRYAAA
jgi:beta-xylosidase